MDQSLKHYRNLNNLGNEQNFFHGNYPGEHRCKCYDTNSCLNNGVTEEQCNCDAQLPTWAQDKGVITATDLLPISAVMYGPLSFDIENANFTIGPLRCSGESIQNSLPSQPSNKDIKTSKKLLKMYPKKPFFSGLYLKKN